MIYIEAVSVLSVYAAILVIAYILKKRQSANVAWWEIILFLFVGLFSFSIDFVFFGAIHKLALLPLGAVLFYLFTINKSTAREKYKPFVWLGFVANYAFFITNILLIPLTNVFYPPGELETYIKSFENAEIVTTHISAPDTYNITDDAYELLQNATVASLKVDQWYIDQAYDQKAYLEEKFPYMLHNVTAPTGMNYDVFYFVEDDGKGLLIQTPDKHYYFRASKAFLSEEGDQS